MISSSTFENFIREIEDCFRSHSRVQGEIQKIKNEVFDLAMNNEPIPAETKEKLKQAELDIIFYKEEVEIQKEKLVKSILAIKLGD